MVAARAHGASLKQQIRPFSNCRKKEVFARPFGCNDIYFMI